LLLYDFAATTAPSFSSKESNSKKADLSTATGITLVDITTAADPASCREWLEQFQRLLQRQREHAREW
jgi:hypothetical protein